MDQSGRYLNPPSSLAEKLVDQIDRYQWHFQYLQDLIEGKLKATPRIWQPKLWDRLEL